MRIGGRGSFRNRTYVNRSDICIRSAYILPNLKNVEVQAG